MDAEIRQRLTAMEKEILALIGEVSGQLETDTGQGRGEINATLWRLQRKLGTAPGYFSDSGQDRVLDSVVFKGKRGGTFVELGGNDGLVGSPTLYFELMRGWNGVLIEGSPTLCDAAAAFRRCECIEAVVAGREEVREFLEIRAGEPFFQQGGLIDCQPKLQRQLSDQGKLDHGRKVEVRTRTLADILDTAGLKQIDYLALDIEGAELEVLESFPFDRFDITAISVENQRGPGAYSEILGDAGFVLLEYLGLDEIYIHNTANVDL